MVWLIQAEGMQCEPRMNDQIHTFNVTENILVFTTFQE